jgi:hypothetical protein
MDKETLKAFIRWLESSSEKTILDKQLAVRAMLENASSARTRTDLRLALRLIDEELVARNDLFRAKRR